MPTVPEVPEAAPSSGDAQGDGSPAARPPDHRAPGWREVLLVAAAILVAVFGLEIASAALPPVREAFRGFPVTVAVLVAGTAGLLLLGIVGRRRR